MDAGSLHAQSGARSRKHAAPPRRGGSHCLRTASAGLTAGSCRLSSVVIADRLLDDGVEPTIRKGNPDFECRFAGRQLEGEILPAGRTSFAV